MLLWLVIARFRLILGVFLGQITLKFQNYTFIIPKKGISHTRLHLLSYCAHKLVHGYGL